MDWAQWLQTTYTYACTWCFGVCLFWLGLVFVWLRLYFPLLSLFSIFIFLFCCSYHGTCSVSVVPKATVNYTNAVCAHHPRISLSLYFSLPTFRLLFKKKYYPLFCPPPLLSCHCLWFFTELVLLFLDDPSCATKNVWEVSYMMGLPCFATLLQSKYSCSKWWMVAPSYSGNLYI